MASSDAKPVPLKNSASRITFPLFDADGDLVSAAAALDSEVSLDGGTFADATSEATEIATGSGMYFLDLTAAEMNADTVAVIVKTTTTGAKTTPLVMYPEETGDINVDVTAFGGTTGTFAAGRPEVNASHVGGTLQTAGDIIARLPAALVAGRMDSNMQAAAGNVITAGVIADGAIDRSALAADTGLQSFRSSTAQAGGATSITLDASASATTDVYKGAWIVLTGGTGVGQARLCTAYNGTTKVATVVPAWATNPDATTTFAVMHSAGSDVQLWVGTAPNVLIAGRVDSNAQVVGDKTGYSVLTVSAGAITSASFATGAIDNAAFNVTETLTANPATGGIVAASFAAGAIDAAAIATDAIGSSELSQGAADKVWLSATRTLTSGAAPSAAAIADAVWDEAIADHLTAGSTGSKLNSAASAGDPWSTSLPGSYASGTGGYIVGNLERRGAGSVHYELVVQNSAGTAIDGCEVYVTNDSAGNTVVAGTLTTNAFGKVTFQLDPGTYYAWRKKSGFTFTNPKTFTVT